MTLSNSNNLTGLVQVLCVLFSINQPCSETNSKQQEKGGGGVGGGGGVKEWQIAFISTLGHQRNPFTDDKNMHFICLGHGLFSEVIT